MAKTTQSLRMKKNGKKTKTPGTLIIIGGAEDKTGDKTILKQVVERTGSGKLVLITAASQVADQLYHDYTKVFKELGLKNIVHLYVEQPEDTRDPEKLYLFEDATCVFFTGGDQLRITTKLGGTEIIDRIFDIYNRGGLIAGTSAGASIMGKTMLVGGGNAESHKVGNWMMAPGLGFAEEMLIDQHFAQRGRIGRLIGAVALNPGVLGIGIDEDTAIKVEGDKFEVIGNNAVYIVDGRTVSYTNISEATAERTMSMHNVTLHILAENEVFHIHHRKVQPVQNSNT